jgi:hypothetical protein
MNEKIEKLKKTVQEKLPEFAQMCNAKDEAILLHQDAFAADYQDEEYSLLGMAIKYAGLHGKSVTIIGQNDETLKKI